jgi:hypothetical protein
VGFVCALLAIAPVIFERGGRLPNISLGLLLLAVLLSGATASLVATLAALRSPCCHHTRRIAQGSSVYIRVIRG